MWLHPHKSLSARTFLLIVQCIRICSALAAPSFSEKSMALRPQPFIRPFFAVAGAVLAAVAASARLSFSAPTVPRWMPQRGQCTSSSSCAPVSVTLETPLQKVQVVVNWDGRLSVNRKAPSGPVLCKLGDQFLGARFAAPTSARADQPRVVPLVAPPPDPADRSLLCRRTHAYQSALDTSRASRRTRNWRRSLNELPTRLFLALPTHSAPAACGFAAADKRVPGKPEIDERHIPERHSGLPGGAEASGAGPGLWRLRGFSGQLRRKASGGRPQSALRAPRLPSGMGRPSCGQDAGVSPSTRSNASVWQRINALQPSISITSSATWVMVLVALLPLKTTEPCH